MKHIVLSLSAALAISATAFAAPRVVTIEGPVEVVSSPMADGKVVYWIQDPQNVKYKVVMPEPEQVRLSSVIERSPTSVIRFNGTVVDGEASPTLNVTGWDTVTRTTTTVTDELGNSRTTEKTTSVQR